MAAQQPIPSRLRASAASGNASGLTFTWRGGRVVQIVTQALADEMEQQRSDIEATLRRELHRYPSHTEHRLADEAFAEVTVRSGRRTLTAGSRAPYTAFHELGTSTFEGHPQIREIMDRFIPVLLPRIRRRIQESGGGR